ncbi:ComEC/Rec2 family competence protein [Algibacter mikhailovii]|uniref:ComEC/Rec2 family competence protein n=1 Tax=Algibacter mikhailovii TaxID=425498 RepID=UPI002495073B|nr:ComEC/Rec2 family competence protein [Algibacter mikhailovii]
MKLLNFNIIKLTLCLIIGILISHFIGITLIGCIYLTIVLLTCVLLLLIRSKKKFKKDYWFGLCAMCAMISIGILTSNFQNEKNRSSHYTNQFKKTDSLKVITFKVRAVLKPSAYHDKYIIDLKSIDNATVSGKTLLNIEKNTLSESLKIDDIYISKILFRKINPPLNPYQFDYKNHLSKKYIYHQIFITKNDLLKVQRGKTTLFGFANSIREYINKKLKPYNFKSDELAILNALLLGQRHDISDKIYTNYVNAGAIHILAVSGLHVGIILLILSYFFKPLEWFKHGKPIKTLLLVSFLWCFALIAGLSASVTRAVTMFSIIAIALNLKRPTNIYNTLAISILVILLFKPMLLFDVGFQLSYLAVLGIVTIDPLLYQLWQPKSWVIEKFWHAFTVTMAAQCGIIPLSLYYFHQFPGLFFISNLVIIPLLGIILGLGVLVISLATTNLLPQIGADIYGYIIARMNDFIGWIALQDAFLFQHISFSRLNLFLSYLFIIVFIKFLIQKNYGALRTLLVAILIIQSMLIYNRLKPKQNEFIIFHKSRHSLIGNTVNNQLTIAHDISSQAKNQDIITKNYATGRHINAIHHSTLRSVYQFNNEKLLIIDSLGIYKVKSFRPDYVLLRQSPKINLNRLIDSLLPKHIIADGSNYKSYIQLWGEICKKRKIPFHPTHKKGAYIISY